MPSGEEPSVGSGLLFSTHFLIIDSFLLSIEYFSREIKRILGNIYICNKSNSLVASIEDVASVVRTTEGKSAPPP